MTDLPHRTDHWTSAPIRFKRHTRPRAGFYAVRRGLGFSRVCAEKRKARLTTPVLRFEGVGTTGGVLGVLGFSQPYNISDLFVWGRLFAVEPQYTHALLQRRPNPRLPALTLCSLDVNTPRSPSTSFFIKSAALFSILLCTIRILYFNIFQRFLPLRYCMSHGLKLCRELNLCHSPSTMLRGTCCCVTLQPYPPAGRRPCSGILNAPRAFLVSARKGQKYVDACKVTGNVKS